MKEFGISRQVDDREEEFIAKSVKAMNHQLLYSGWVTLKSPNKTLRDRIIVVTTFRTMFLKVEESKITV